MRIGDIDWGWVLRASVIGALGVYGVLLFLAVGQMY